MISGNDKMHDIRASLNSNDICERQEAGVQRRAEVLWSRPRDTETSMPQS